MERPRVVLRKGHIGVSFYFIFSGSVFVNVEEFLERTGHVMWRTAVILERGDSFGVGLHEDAVSIISVVKIVNLVLDKNRIKGSEGLEYVGMYARPPWKLEINI